MSTPSAEPALVRYLGHADYDSTFAAMRAYTDARTPDSRDQLWIVEHDPVFTLGLGADRGHLLAGADAIPVVQTDPGGELYARQFVHKIEQAIINVLTAYNLAGERIAGAPGIYLAEGAKKGAKIAALGLKVRGNGCTYHGLSLNVAMDLAPFSWINPCGYAGLETVDMRSMGVSAPLADVQQALAQELLRLLYEVPVPEPMLTP